MFCLSTRLVWTPEYFGRTRSLPRLLITGSSSAMTFTSQDKRIPVCHREGFPLPASFHCGEMKENVDLFSKWFTDRVNCQRLIDYTIKYSSFYSYGTKILPQFVSYDTVDSGSREHSDTVKTRIWAIAKRWWIQSMISLYVINVSSAKREKY